MIVFEWVIILALIVSMYIVINKYEKRLNKIQEDINANRDNISKNHGKLKEHKEKINSNYEKINKNHGKLEEHHDMIERMWVTIPKQKDE